MTYEGGWVEQQTLLTQAHGGAAHGAWFLLEGAVRAPLITGYRRGTYLVDDAWLPASALVHHTSAELAAARARATAATVTTAPTHFDTNRCDSTQCTLGARHTGLCSHLRVSGKRRRH